MQPTDYALGLLFAAWLDLAGWGLVIYGAALTIGGIVALAVIIVQWGGVTLGPDPEIPPPPAPPPAVVHSPHPEPNYRRPDSDTGVVPRIPGATPAVQQQAGPVCPFRGGPWHALCPSAPKERTDETVEMAFAETIAAADEQVRAAYSLAPQFAALSRFFSAVDEARADTDQAIRRLAANARPDCPLTTHELVIPTVGETPVHRAIADREPTQELSEVMKKVSAP